MDLNSWRPEDTARRLAIYFAACAGVFAFMALWMGLPLHFLLALPAGVVAGGLVYALAYPVLLLVFRR